MADSKASRGAVLQFEFDVARMKSMTRETSSGTNTTKRPYSLSLDVVRGALQDVIENGGTLVVVVGDKTITVVQRPDADNLD